MAAMLVKRKRRTAEALGEEQEGSNDGSGSLEFDAQEIFRRHFEARFKPLPPTKKSTQVPEEPQEEFDESEENSEWDGISDAGEAAVQVVEHTDAQSRMATMSKEELKAFMSSRPPTAASNPPLIRDKAGAIIDDDDPSETANLKKDLALQRLLAESHLLDSASNPTLTGKNRHKAMDLRFQALGSKTSILKQEKMPMAHRKGMLAKQSEREDKRRREARENGIILEKAQLGTKSPKRKRERDVGAPEVGRFSGGTLKLSKKDIYDIEGPKRSTSGRGGRGGRGGGRGGKRHG